MKRILRRIIETNRGEDIDNYRIRLEQYYENRDALFRILGEHIPIILIDTTDKTQGEVYEILRGVLNF